MRVTDSPVATYGRPARRSQVLTVRVPVEMHDRLKAAAAAGQTSLGSVIRLAIASIVLGSPSSNGPPHGAPVKADAGAGRDPDSRNAVLELADCLRQQTPAIQLLAEALATLTREVSDTASRDKTITPNAADAAGRETRAPSKASRGSDTRRVSRDTKAGKRCRTR